ncbi:hypothetical protein BGX34_003053 [Mortierella sp. NVP85]|nr:hypothetical protein BGX34_003053 [Mortierella sp. NVP85]
MSNIGVYYLLEQLKLVEGVQLTPLPDHLIATFRPIYLDSANIQDQNIDLDPSMKYLTFLPHPGFHNQRAELENALLLAKLLNRTLIIPKVYLGPQPARGNKLTKGEQSNCRGWFEADTEAESKGEEENGDKESEGGNEVEGEKVIPLLRTAGDVLFFDDTNLYVYRFTENPDAAESLRTQSKFKSSRSTESRAWQLMVRYILQVTTQRIVGKICGNIADQPGELHTDKQTFDDLMEVDFVGIHIRMSDGHFSLTARDTIENIRQELMWQMDITDDNENGNRASSVGIAGRTRALYHRHFLKQQL